ncbi:MAG TPA: hypothetical protein PKL57_03950 [Candidatus Wallbacteria bacterium]|nr:hypothetical protein [Candidatus Wallbacteria bacterium]
MSKFSLIYKCRLIEALGELKKSGLFAAGGASLKTALINSFALIYGVRNIDLHNFMLAEGDFLEIPAYPSGCSVGGGITRIFFNLKDYKKHKNEIIEHNLRLIWSVFDITAEGSAAGYDSHGITLAALNLKTGAVDLVREKTSGDIDERGYITINNILKKCPEIETGDALVLVTGAQTRAATQGDNMYSRANAHLHNEKMTREIFGDIMSAAELEKFRKAYPLVVDRQGPFSVGHNGDVNSRIKWEKFFLNMGFETKADSDSKEIPRIIRIVYECLMAEEILKAHGRFTGWLMDILFQNQVLSHRAKFEEDGVSRMLTIEEQKRVIIETASKMLKSGASKVLTACALAAKLIYLVDPTSIFVFETLTNVIDEKGAVIPVTTIVRGPKSGGMFLYRDSTDPTIPVKFASSLSNMRNQIKKYENEKQEEIAVDYITSGAKILVREGTVSYHSLADWQAAEIYQPAGSKEPEFKIYDVLKSCVINKKAEKSPIIDYQLKGLEKSAILKEEGYFKQKSRVERTVIYETILGKIISGPNFLKGKQIKSFATEEPAAYAIDNQYGVEIYLSYVTLLRNTRHIFKCEYDSAGEISGRIKLNLEAFFNTSNPALKEGSIEKIIKKIDKIYGFAEGTSRNILGMCFSIANLEGLNGCFMNALESNLARIERPRVDETSLALFVSNSGGTKPVVALAEELLSKSDQTYAAGPYVMSVTNLITSELAILTSKSLGASVTNMPWEKSVGSTFAAFTAMQNILALIVYIHEVKGLIKPERAQYLYRALADFPRIAKKTLASASVKEKTSALASYIAGNNIDISYVGAFNGFDGCEGALKFAEMMQHPRVKFFSGAYEQHGQRATYLRSHKSAHGSLVILHIPNLETSIGSWMAQLIKEDKPRVGKIAVIASEEDLMKLYENGADYVIPAPSSTTENLFTDALSKLILDNILTLATILESNKIADEIVGWGARLLDLTSAAARSDKAVPAIIKELKIIWKKYKRLEIGGMFAEDRVKTLYELESQRVDAIISEEEREKSIARIYKDSRSISIINAETRSYIDDIFAILLNWDAANAEETPVFYNLINDLILEFSNRGLAMSLADERFEDSPYMSKAAIHYQGMAKIIGANPIKPDNIAKFQQGWGISSFILEAGRRFSDASLNAASFFDKITDIEDGAIESFACELEKLKFSKESAMKFAAVLKLVKVKKINKYSAQYAGKKNYRFVSRDGAKAPDYSPAQDFIDSAAAAGSSDFNVCRTNGCKYNIECLFLDKYGDAENLIVLETENRKLDEKHLSQLLLNDDYLRTQVDFLNEWFSDETQGGIVKLLVKLCPIQLAVCDRKELARRFETLKDKRNLIDSIAKFQPVLEQMHIDPYSFSINDLKTMRNISNAIVSFKGGAPYHVQKKNEAGKTEFYGVREKERAFGIAGQKASAFDKPGKLRGNKKITCVGGRLKMGYGKDGAPIVIIPCFTAGADLEKIVLLHIEIDENLTIGKKIETLGEKYNLIVNNVSEHFEWDDNFLNLVAMKDLMMLSDEEIADNKIIETLKKGKTAFNGQ